MRRPLKDQILISLLSSALFALALWLVHVFEPGLLRYFTDHMGASSPDTAIKIIKMVLWACLSVVLIRALSAIIFGLIFKIRRGYEAPTLVRNIFSIIGYIICFLIIFKTYYEDVSLTPLFATSTIFGVILGFALQDTLGNLFAGISLHADKPFQVGDVIVVGQKTGVIESITWRGVKIRTFTNHLVLVSNSSVARESIEVAPRDNLNARLVFFNTLYTDSPAKTIHVVREAVREAENVSQKIKPIVRIRHLADSGVDWEVKYWLEDYAKYNDTDALVRQRIWYAFRRAGLNFAYPTRTLLINRPGKAEGVTTIQSEIIERLSAVDIFAPLSNEETARLASASVSHIFAPGETVIRAGDDGSSMFVVHKGHVNVQITDNGKPRNVASLKEGDFFGEMALLTGEPRTANVIAVEETEVLEIGHQALKPLFESNPDLVEALSHIIAERRDTLRAKALDAEAQPVEPSGIIESIKRFFGID